MLVGQDLIRAAQERAQISQIEKFQTATNTFYAKYQALPGDMNAVVADQFGFAPRGSGGGQGDGNGMIEGTTYDGRSGGILQDGGESTMFWVDLSQAGLIAGGFNTSTSFATQGFTIPSSAMNVWFPQAAIGGQGNYVFVTGGTGGGIGYMNFSLAGPNFYVVEGATSVGIGSYGEVQGEANAFTVQQAYDIDKKTDDGLPTSGRVLTVMLSTQATWVDYQGPPTNSYTQNGPGGCYNNNTTTGATMVYSLSYPTYVACTLAFQFQ